VFACSCVHVYVFVVGASRGPAAAGLETAGLANGA